MSCFVVLRYSTAYPVHPPVLLGVHTTLEGAQASLEPLRAAVDRQWMGIVERLDGLGFTLMGRNFRQGDQHVSIQEVDLTA